MSRIARIVVPDLPHHIVQRGNRRQKVFFQENDYEEYLHLLKNYTGRFNVDILAYCLMPNHVHLIVVPNKVGSLAQAIGETHRNYTLRINLKKGWRGYLWQGRFLSYVLDERYLLSATRYILLNPVRAKLVKKAWDYKWSSAKYHVNRKSQNRLIKDKYLKETIGDWKEFLGIKSKKNETELMQLHERTGRPLGNNAFLDRLESKLKIHLKKRRAGRPRKEK